jgi:hypothetical protein
MTLSCKGFGDVRLRRFERFEGLAVVFYFGFNLSRLHAQTHYNLVFAVVRVSIRDGVERFPPARD